MGFIHISRENAGIVGLHRPAGAPAGGMLVKDWMDAGGSKKARKAAKALGSKTDEMEHAIITQRKRSRTA